MPLNILFAARPERWVTYETPLRQALEQILEADLGCLMVVAHGKLLGVVTERDLLRATAQWLNS